MRHRLLFFLLFATACIDAPSRPGSDAAEDGGQAIIDAAGPDAAGPDAAVPDAAVPDAAVPDAAPATELVAHWPLDESSGLVATDIVNDATGMLNEGASLGAVGYLGASMTNTDPDEDGYGGFMAVEVASLPGGVFEDKFSMSLWFKGGAKSQVLFSTGSGQGMLIRASPSDPLVLDAYFGGGRYLKQDVYPDDGRWHNLAWTVDCSDGSTCLAWFYLDGSLVADNTDLLPGTVNEFDGATVSTLYVGALRSDGHSPFLGQFDEFKIYRGALPD